MVEKKRLYQVLMESSAAIEAVTKAHEKSVLSVHWYEICLRILKEQTDDEVEKMLQHKVPEPGL